MQDENTPMITEHALTPDGKRKQVFYCVLPLGICFRSSDNSKPVNNRDSGTVRRQSSSSQSALCTLSGDYGARFEFRLVRALRTAIDNRDFQGKRRPNV